MLNMLHFLRHVVLFTVNMQKKTLQNYTQHNIAVIRDPDVENDIGLNISLEELIMVLTNMFFFLVIIQGLLF